MMPPRPHDVAIVGGGAVGLVLACLLAARRLDVVVLERRTTRSTRTRAIGIHTAGLDVLDQVGIGDAVRAEAEVVAHGVAMSRGRRLGAFDFGDAPIRTLPQHRTESLLAERFRTLAPLGLRRGVTVIGLAQREECVRLDTHDDEGTVGEVLARVVIGADGGRSAVRDWLGAEWRPRGGRGHYAMADEHAPDPPRSTAILHLEPGGVVESFPLPVDARRWVVRLDGAATDLGPDAFAALIARRLDTAPRPDRLGEPVPFATAQHIARPYVRGRVALLGDAAHVLSPIGGQGMNLGWLDAIVLDRAVAAIVGGTDPARAFVPYARRRGTALRAMRRAAFNTFLGRPAGGAWLWLRTALVRVIASRPFRPIARAIVTIRR